MSSGTSSQGGGSGIGIFTVLFLIFLTLKLTGNIDWSWWWVTAPIWGPLAAILAVLVVLGFYFVLWPAEKRDGQ